MWFFLAFVAICFTIIVLFRMFIDMRRLEHQHNRMMASDRRDYERYIDIKDKENPRPALPDFSKAIATPSMNIDAYDMALEAVRYWKHDELPTVNTSTTGIPEPYVGTLTAQQLEALKRTYQREDYERFMRKQGRTL